MCSLFHFFFNFIFIIFQYFLYDGADGSGIPLTKAAGFVNYQLNIIPLFWCLPCYVLYVFDHHWNAIFGRKSLDDRGLHSSHIFAAWPTMLSRPPFLALFSVGITFYK